jgi:hypothetical protein
LRKISLVIRITIISDDVIEIIKISEKVRAEIEPSLSSFSIKLDSASSSSPERSFQIKKRKNPSKASESVETESSGNNEFNGMGGFSRAVLPK